MTDQHTSGPWHALGLGARDGRDIAIVRGEHAYQLVASVENIDGTEDEANARLIAAAPAMLDTLRDTLAHFESIIARIKDGAHIYPADRNALDARFQQAHLVIDQATGIGQSVNVRA